MITWQELKGMSLMELRTTRIQLTEDMNHMEDPAVKNQATQLLFILDGFITLKKQEEEDNG